MYAAPLYLMLLCCIKIHPSMPIFNVSSRSFLWQRVAAEHGECHWGAAITQSHYRNILLCPPRSSFSVFLHNYLKVITEINGVLSLPRALLKALDNHSIHTCPASLDTILKNTQQHAQHTENHTNVCTHPICCP